MKAAGSGEKSIKPSAAIAIHWDCAVDGVADHLGDGHPATARLLPEATHLLLG